jgi:hypothetical protein
MTLRVFHLHLAPAGLPPFRVARAFPILGLILVFSGRLLAAGAPPQLDQQILPLLKTHCVKCHGPAKQEGGLRLSTAIGVARGGTDGPVVVPSDLEQSVLWQKVVSGEMPPDRPLPEAEQQLLKNWILQGAAGLPVLPAEEGSVIEHWAFRPLSQIIPPKVKNEQLIRTGIDRFIQSALEKKGLSIGERADRSTLIRRVSFDLTGLPPDSEAIARYLSDSDPDAYEKVVDGSLKSDRYGEHWGKYWLDAAGYMESNGYFDDDTRRPYAYRYRDYVIRAMNRDLAFDIFLKQQMAGDELAQYQPGDPVTPEVIELLEASHFFRNGPDGSGESDGNPWELMRDRRAVVDTAIEIFGSAVLGLTLQCARCHDHKFEPVTQRDYYQLYAVLHPAFDVDDWVNPQDRVVCAPLPEEVIQFEQAIKSGRVRAEDRPGKIAWLTDVTADPSPVHIAVRGDFTEEGPVVDAGGLEFLTDAHNLFAPRKPRPGWRGTGRRLALAEWLTRPGSRPAALLARVQVNRIWQEYFGTGLVATPANLGHSGASPTHPELLDWLAGEFINSGWSLKSLHHLIVNSAVYQQSSVATEQAQEIDPENRLLSHMPLRRLTAEEIRDALLASSGELDLTMGGPADGVAHSAVGEVVFSPNERGKFRRSVYLERRRSEVPTLLRAFDTPSIVTNCLERQESMTPLQSLTLLNAAFVHRCAMSMAKRLSLQGGLENDDRISYAFLLTFGREPDAMEMRRSLQFIRTQTNAYTGRDQFGQRLAWTDFCHTLIASNAFLYLE